MSDDAPNKEERERYTEITEDMIEAGLKEISGFELIDAWDGFLGKRELVTAIYQAMARVASRKTAPRFEHVGLGVTAEGEFVHFKDGKITGPA
jgi:hypothetical protein